jgi:NAD+ synthase (glutamine-hydrolysing)
MTRPIVTLVQFRPRKGDYLANLGRVARVFEQVLAAAPRPDVLVFPEAALSGYFLEGGVRDAAMRAGNLVSDLAAIHKEVTDRLGETGAAGTARSIDVVAGFYEEYNNQYYNSAFYATLHEGHGKIRHVHRKLFLPTYGVFDEKRFVRAGHTVSSFDTDWGRASVIICEDAWHSLVPTLAALDGAQIIFVPSASPARGLVPARVVGGTEDDMVPASLERWERVARTISAEHGVFLALSQLVGFEGGKGFPGVSMLTGPDGGVIARGPLFDEALVTAACDLSEITRARADSPLLTDLEAALPHLLQRFPTIPAAPAEYETANREALSAPQTGQVLPTVGERVADNPLAVNGPLVERWLVSFLRDEVNRRRGFGKGIVGLSGGVDSSLTAYLAVKALGKDNVIGVRMPYATSSSESLEHAALVAKELGIRLETVDITAAVDAYASATASPPDATRLGNVMARMRMITLFDLSAALGALPLGTGNKTERLLGYFTWHADDTPPVNPLGDLFKTEVWDLARHVGVPEEIVSKPATADLIRGQTDEADIGISYQKADQILYWLLQGLDVASIIARGFTVVDVECVNRRLSSTHWKRRLPTVAMMSQTAIGEYYLRPVDY